MKKLLLLVALCCFCAGVASAQMIEIVHLKNGSQIRGIITEQVPNKHLKIQTSDGSIFVYSYDEIEKISKEMTQQRNAYKYGQNGFGRQQINSSFRPHYEGSVDAGYSICVGAIDGTGRINVSTSHGCRLIPYLYVGAGAGFDYYHTPTPSGYGIPIFADFRGYFTQQTLKPFLNFRIGYSLGDVEGLYFSPSAGINFKKLDVSLGYTYQKADIIFYDAYLGFITGKANIGAVTIKVGVRF